MNFSYWEKKHWLTSVDLTIVGSGLVGLFSAIYLKQKYPNKSVRVIERSPIPQGASTKNAGFACFGTVGEILDDLTTMSEEDVINTIALRFSGLQRLQAFVPAHIMDYKQCGGTEVFRSKEAFEKCGDNIKEINRLIGEAIHQGPVFALHKGPTFSRLYSQAIFNPLEGQLNPVLLIKYLQTQANALGVELCYGLSLTQFEKTDNYQLTVQDKLSFTSSKVLIATNAFTKGIMPDLDIIPTRNQVLITKPLTSTIIDGTFHMDQGYIYFRNVGDRLLLGGARNIDPNTELSASFEKNDKIVDYLKDFAQDYLLDKSYHIDDLIEDQWSGIIAIGESKVPLVKSIDNNLYIAARLGGMGVATGAAVASKVADMIAF